MHENKQQTKRHIILKKPVSDLSEDELKAVIEIILKRINEHTDILTKLFSIIEINANNSELLSNKTVEIQNQQSELIKAVSTLTSFSNETATILTSLLSKK